MSLVVAGTDTDVGKTLVSAIVLTRYAELTPSYWKPIATGGREESDTRTVASLTPRGVRILPETYLYGPPVSPHLAARRADRPIQREVLLESFQTHCTSSDALVIEGVGGLLVPLSDDGWLLADLLAELALPVLLVASTRVGTINHTLLSIEAAHRRRLSVAGVVLTGPADEADNREAIERFGGIGVVDVVPPLHEVTAATVLDAARHFDAAQRLRGPLIAASAAEVR